MKGYGKVALFLNAVLMLGVMFFLSSCATPQNSPQEQTKSYFQSLFANPF
jgi:hypothetical protein